MKKIITILIISAFLIPSFSFAAWDGSYKAQFDSIISSLIALVAELSKLAQSPASNPVSTPTPASTIQSFSPVIELGGENNFGILHSEYANDSCLGCSLTDIGWLYVTINEPFDTAKIDLTNGDPAQDIKGEILMGPTGSGLLSGQRARIKDLVPNKIYTYKITLSKSGQTKTATGQFTSRFSRIVKIDNGEHYEFLNYLNEPYLAQVKLKAKTFIPHAKIYYNSSLSDSSSDALFESHQYFLSLNTGDTIELQNVRDYIKVKNVDYIAKDATEWFDIVGATSTSRGWPIQFVF